MGEIQCRLQVLPGQAAILLRVAVLDVEQDEVERIEPGVVQVGMQEALGVERHVQVQFGFDAGGDGADEAGLQHRFAAGEGDAAGDAQEGGVWAHLGHRLLHRDLPAVVQFPGVGVVAVEAAEQAARGEEDEPHARPVHRPAVSTECRNPVPDRRGGMRV